MTSLRRQVQEYKTLLYSKEEELTEIKSSSKFAKFHDLDTKLRSTVEELNMISERYSQLRTAIGEYFFIKVVKNLK